MSEEVIKHLNFIEEIVEEDIKNGKHSGRILTRFPPEPNGYLHIGHAKSICLNFGLAQKYNGKTNLRFDDTNPVTEEMEYIDSIKYDIKWLGFDWETREYYASDYFPQLHDFAIQLIKAGKAYVDDSSADVISQMKGTPTEPGTLSPFRGRSVSENLELFAGMKDGKFKEGEKVLRAKIDMSSPNMHMRDPILYRILYTPHHRTGNTWCIYPMYDFAHGQSDAIEGITHSICTLEFENHRPLYNWFIESLSIFPSQQIEFARLNLEYTVMSKRKLMQLVNEGFVSAWDDPRMSTISGMRRRGYTAEAIRNFAVDVGVARREHVIEFSRLENVIRDDLNKKSNRVMAVLEPIKIVLTNYPKNEIEWLELEINPEQPELGTRKIPFGAELYIESEDFMEVPIPKYFRLSPGAMVRLKSAYIIRCDEVIKNSSGEIDYLKCSYFPESKSGHDQSGLKVKTTIHWVEVSHSITAKVNLYDRLFTVPNPLSEEGDFKDYINPNSLIVLDQVRMEPDMKFAQKEDRYQFMRKGYFCLDTLSTPEQLIFNRTISLKDSWSKIQDKV
ncbi:MAG: glutamine--tRNA ligase/YqeY domain fusion protein [Saprospiraceae bacterium]|nr:glutamine--tRNA ligase/YqeY domain fusion protein [Saprospiraceae bacterium]